MTYEEAPQSVQSIIYGILIVEKGYVDNPKDRGGKTNYGITEKTARANGYKGDMRDLPLARARDIYATEYYYRPNLHLIATESEKIAEEVMDSGVNVGTKRAVKWLQESLNVLNRDQEYYEDVVEDGVMGSKTQASLRKYLHKRHSEGEEVLFKLLNCLQGEYYIRLAQSDKSQEDFIYGWANKRVGH